MKDRKISFSIMRGLLMKGGPKVLDAGCGSGRLLAPLASIRKFGVEMRPGRILQAQRSGYEVAKCDMDAEPLPYNDASFDSVVMSDALEHLVHTDFVLGEINRVLKQGGLFIICIPNISQPVSWGMQILFDLPPMFAARYHSSHVRDFTLRTLKAALRKNGFKHTGAYGTYVYPFDNIIGRAAAIAFPRLSIKIIIAAEKISLPKKKEGVPKKGVMATSRRLSKLV